MADIVFVQAVQSALSRPSGVTARLPNANLLALLARS